MRYTLFFKNPDEPFIFKEGDNLGFFMGEAKRLAEAHPNATITVCDRTEDVMLFSWEQGTGGECNRSLQGISL